jgi:hypothetical protein
MRCASALQCFGKTLEEVQEMWADPKELHQAIHTWR